MVFLLGLLNPTNITGLVQPILTVEEVNSLAFSYPAFLQNSKFAVSIVQSKDLSARGFGKFRISLCINHVMYVHNRSMLGPTYVVYSFASS